MARSKTGSPSSPASRATKGRKGRTKSRIETRSVRGDRGKGRTGKGRDPKGGLTAEGRREFARKQGSHLKPGVRKVENAMSREEMRRKGSWAVRFYGRKESLPPLRDKSDEPTRLALTAHAWGEPVPSTERAARKIAAKGRRLLEKAERRKAA